MVGLVLVSHSRALAQALVSLVAQVAPQSGGIAIAAGVGEDRQEFGTDAVEIMEAIQSVYSPDGVLVLMDLGSAILSAEMAVELLPPEVAEKVRFCAAPIVEGAIAAAVQAGLGSEIEAVFQEAQSALLPKQEHFGMPQTPASPPAALPVGEAAEQVVLTLINLHGLHARPAARFVQTAASFNADVHVKDLTNGKGPVSARSLNALATLGAVRDHQIAITASGIEASQALAALRRMVEDGFGEAAEEQAPPSGQAIAPPSIPGAEDALQAVPVSEGAAFGPFYRYQPALPPVPVSASENPQADWERLERALETTRQAIRQRRQALAATLGEEEAAIFDAHLLITQDEELLEQARWFIFQEHRNAADACQRAIGQAAASYQALDDAYLAQRAADVLDVGNQVLFALAEKVSEEKITFIEPVILYAQDLTPTETAQLDMSQVLGILTVGGGPTSHSAILARALGIPAVSGASPALERLPVGTTVGLDGSTGLVWIDPTDEVRQQLGKHRSAWLELRQRLLKTSAALAVTADGRRIEVAANVGNLLDARAAVENGAEGIGLLRTEFLFLTRSTPPSEAEQCDVLRQIGEVMTAGRPVLVRTLDVGGDKELPYIAMPPEANPFLGVRAVRLSFQNPELFQAQLRAILRAAYGLHFRIMFPMIANLDEVLRARAALEQARVTLSAEGLPHAWPIETGIMIEIPAAALLSHEIAPQVDFFSIGTNDLTQYTLAAERGNPALASFTDALHPAVLRLIGQVAESAHHFGKWSGVCGELAGDPLATAVLVGLGVDELSLNPAGIPRIKAILRNLRLPEAQSLARQVLQVESASAARRLADEFYRDRVEPGLV